MLHGIYFLANINIFKMKVGRPVGMFVNEKNPFFNGFFSSKLVRI